MDDNAGATDQNDEASDHEPAAESGIEPSDLVEHAAEVAGTDFAQIVSVSSSAQAVDQPSESMAPAAALPSAGSMEQDLSGFVEIPGPGRVDQAGWELIQLVSGLKPPFEPQSKITNPPPLEPPAFLARLEQSGAGPHFAQNNSGAPPQIIVELRVSLTADALEQVTNEPLRKAAGHSRGETLIVARKLDDLIREIRVRELQRRVLWERFSY
jgi:hypothetical protein